MSVKKVVLLIAVIAMLLTGCIQERPFTPTREEDRPPSGYTSIPNHLHFNTQEEHDACFRAASYMPDYVSWDMVKGLGNIVRMSVWEDVWELGDFKDCGYSFKEDGKYEFSLYVRTEPYVNIYETKVPLLNEPPEDLRFCAGEEHRAFHLGNVQYRYQIGKLSSVRWSSGTHHYTLDIDDINEYEPSSNAFIDGILNLESAKKTIQQFNTSVWWKFLLRKHGGWLGVVQLLLAILCVVMGILQIFNLCNKKVLPKIQPEKQRKYGILSGITTFVAAAFLVTMTVIIKYNMLAVGWLLMLYGIAWVFFAGAKWWLYKSCKAGEGLTNE